MSRLDFQLTLADKFSAWWDTKTRKGVVIKDFKAHEIYGAMLSESCSRNIMNIKKESHKMCCQLVTDEEEEKLVQVPQLQEGSLCLPMLPALSDRAEFAQYVSIKRVWLPLVLNVCK